jgi:hypothetical protein
MKEQVPPRVLDKKLDMQVEWKDGVLTVYTNLGGTDVAYKVDTASEDVDQRLELLLWTIWDLGASRGARETKVNIGSLLKSLIAEAEKGGS